MERSVDRSPRGDGVFERAPRRRLDLFLEDRYGTSRAARIENEASIEGIAPSWVSAGDNRGMEILEGCFANFDSERWRKGLHRSSNSNTGRSPTLFPLALLVARTEIAWTIIIADPVERRGTGRRGEESDIR
ncbi:hypothetical protein KM043_006487 [Ampulex compressa]|nr:hypothetical protein KM043_006487 [Ampulex compressa]